MIWGALHKVKVVFFMLQVMMTSMFGRRRLAKVVLNGVQPGRVSEVKQ